MSWGASGQWHSGEQALSRQTRGTRWRRSLVMLEAFRWGHTGEGKAAGPSEQSEGTQAWATPQRQPGPCGRGGQGAGDLRSAGPGLTPQLTQVAADRDHALFSGCPDPSLYRGTTPPTKHAPHHTKVLLTDTVTNHSAQPHAHPQCCPMWARMAWQQFCDRPLPVSAIWRGGA